ncbi:threonine/homoserine/homoserine lactone efflux protein [Paenibacillus phyllosphaerae]|uniref:Threonine/homoserine/homoserine lactone efflux protein n=1 Tax=Paenibacillus phyllosphaerae TaxID=274593 RepID=A0A7W5FNE6_9BACL|nr:LysE family transporter [Paenibacillus phyllosphaerae]MBB3111103.1 threonine/homoserine/homoserine lactone efflux protein [Paenibacillus phyllosphaerae]
MSVQLLVSYIFLGLTLAAPIGPVNSARLDKGIKNGFWHAWIVGTGSMIADGIFMVLIYLGIAKFLNIPIIQIYLWLFGAIILIYSGIESITSANKVDVEYRTRRKEALWRSFLSGFLLSISSPLSILFWLGIYGSILAKTATSYGTTHLLLYSSMIFLGLALWDIFFATLTTGMRRFLNKRSLTGISVFSGLSLIGFGVYFGYQGITAMIEGI